MSDKRQESCSKILSRLLVLQDVDVVFEEQLENIEDIGFEGIGEDSGIDATYVVSSLAVSVQIDDRIASENRNKLDKILRNNLSSYTNFVTVRFIELSVPDIGQSVSANQELSVISIV